METRLKDSDYEKLLEIRFNNPQIKFISAETKPLSENPEGFMGEHFRLKVTYELNGTQSTEKFFIKTKPFDSARLGIVDGVNAYSKEIFLYDFLLREFKKCDFDVSFAAHCYLCVDGETLIMEDLGEKNFQLAPRQSFFSLEQVRSLLKSLALYHAAGFAYEKIKSKELGKKYTLLQDYSEYFEETFFTKYTTGIGLGVDWFNTSITNFKKLIDLMPNNEDYKANFKRLLDVAEIGKVMIEDTGLTKICTHGDLWANNIMFNFKNGLQTCCLVDFQIIRYFYPGFDVLLATHFNTDDTVTSKDFEELYQYYYDTLSDTLAKYGYAVGDILPLDDFKKSLDVVEIEAMMQVASVNSLVFIQAETLTSHAARFHSEISDDNMAEKMSDMKNLISLFAYENDETYRKLITKNMHDLYLSLVKKYCK